MGLICAVTIRLLDLGVTSKTQEEQPLRWELWQSRKYTNTIIHKNKCKTTQSVHICRSGQNTGRTLSKGFLIPATSSTNKCNPFPSYQITPLGANDVKLLKNYQFLWLKKFGISSHWTIVTKMPLGGRANIWCVGVLTNEGRPPIIFFKISLTIALFVCPLNKQSTGCPKKSDFQNTTEAKKSKLSAA